MKVRKVQKRRIHLVYKVDYTLPDVDTLAKQLCVESGELDINRTVYMEPGNRFTNYSGEPAWHPFRHEARDCITALTKLRQSQGKIS